MLFLVAKVAGVLTSAHIKKYKKEKIMKHIVFIILFASAVLFAEEDWTAQQVIQKSIDISSPASMSSYSKQTVYFPNGRQRTFEILTYSKGTNNKSLMIYKKPARVKGDKFLFLKGGDIWVYFSKTGRVRRIASSAKKSKMQGSDFSYEDMSLMSSLNTDYTTKFIEPKNKNYVIELHPKNTSVSYNKLIAYVDKKTFVLHKLEFYKKDKLVKFLTQSKYKKIQDYRIPSLITMQNVRGDSKTIIESEQIKINPKISDSLFNKNNLGQ